MRSLYCCVVMVLISLTVCSPSYSETYYMAVNGNDSNSGDISAPFASLEKAFHALEAGDTLVVKSGEYSVPTSLLLRFKATAAKPITIMGEGKARFVGVYHAATSKNKFGPDVYCGLKIMGSGGVIKNLRLSKMGGAAFGGEITQFVFDNVYVDDYSNYGMLFTNSSDVIIRNSTFTKSAVEHGIYLTGTNNNVLIDRCSFSDTAINGVHMNGKVRNVTIQNSMFYGNSRGWGACVTMMKGATDIVIKNNLFYNNLGHVFTLGNGKVEIYHNTVFNDGDRKGQVFVMIGSTSRWRVRNNIFATNAPAFDASKKNNLSPSADINFNAYADRSSQERLLQSYGFEKNGLFDADFDFDEPSHLPKDPSGLQLLGKSDGISGAPLLSSVPTDFMGNSRRDGGALGAFADPMK